MQNQKDNIEKRIFRNVFSKGKLMIELGIPLPNSFKMRDDPVVLLGMHRSGTTLMAKILEDLNVHMGHRNGKLNESEFFLNINLIIFELFHAFWDFPSNLGNYLEPGVYSSKKISELICKWVNSYRFLKSYVGFKNRKKFYNSPKIPWGWKDPRTTVTWPIWFNIFNSSKFVFIYRNGVDVAESLRKAEHHSDQLIGGRHSSRRAMTLQGGFDIWEEYNTLYLNFKQKYSSAKTIEICYEELLADPNQKLKKIINFIGLDVSLKKLNDTVEKIDSSRKFNFTKNEELYKFYQKNSQHPLMKRFGYDKIKRFNRP